MGKKLNNEKSAIIAPAESNLLENTTLESGKFIYKNNGTVGSFATYSATDYIDVSNLEKIQVYKLFQNCGAFYNSSKTFVSGFGNSTIENPPSDYQIDVPSTAKYVRVSIKTEDINNGAYLTGIGDSAILSIPLSQSVNDNPNQLPSCSAVYNALRWTNLKNKNVVFLGDSMTVPEQATTAYWSIFASLTGCNAEKVAQGGYSFANTGHYGTLLSLVNANQSKFQNADLVVIFAGANDFGHGCSMGTPFVVDGNTKTPSTDLATLCGGMHSVIARVKELKPFVPIIAMLPLIAGNYNTGSYRADRLNSDGNSLRDFVDAEKEVYNFYSVPALDLYALSNIDMLLENTNNYWSNDGLHPNDRAHSIMGKMLFEFVKGVYVL